MKSTTNYMNQEDFKLVLKTIPELGIRKWADDDIKILFKILYWCGLRFIEGCTLLYENIDLERNVVVLGKTKTEKYGVAIIGAPFLDEFTEWLSDKTMGPLFPELTYNTAIKWVYRLGEKLQIPAWVVPQSVSGEKTLSHIFRKSIAKDMVFGTHGKKASINVVSKQMRHKDIATTERYLNVTDEAVHDYWDSQEAENKSHGK